MTTLWSHVFYDFMETENLMLLVMNETIKCKAVFVDMLGITGDGWFPFLHNLLGRTLCL